MSLPLAFLPHRPRSKYRNVRVTVDGITFDSRAEAARWQELKLLERAGEIDGLERQRRYPLIVNGHVIAHYVADFTYRDAKSGAEIVEDLKGVRTDVYRMKAKLMLACHGITILETGKRRRPGPLFKAVAA